MKYPFIYLLTQFNIISPFSNINYLQLFSVLVINYNKTIIGDHSKMNQLIKNAKTFKPIITFGILASITAICFWLFTNTVKLGEAVGELIFHITH